MIYEYENHKQATDCHVSILVDSEVLLAPELLLLINVSPKASTQSSYCSNLSVLGNNYNSVQIHLGTFLESNRYVNLSLSKTKEIFLAGSNNFIKYLNINRHIYMCN